MADEKTTIASQIERIVNERNKIIDHMTSEWSISRSEVDTLEKIRNTIETIECGKDISLSAYSGTTVIPKGYYDGEKFITITDNDGDEFKLIPLPTVTPTEQQQTILPHNVEEGADGFSSVVINPIPKTYGNITKLKKSASSNTILEGYDAFVYGIDGETGQLVANQVTGGIKSLDSSNATISGSKTGATFEIESGYYPNGATKILANANIITPSAYAYTIDDNGKFKVDIEVRQGGYLNQQKLSYTYNLPVWPGATDITPSEQGQTAIGKEHYTTKDIHVKPIPSYYANVKKLETTDNITETSNFILKDNYAIIMGTDENGDTAPKYVKGNIENHGDIDTIYLSLDTLKEYPIRGYYSGGSIKIQPTDKTVELKKEEQHIAAEEHYVLGTVTVPGIGSYMENKTNLAPYMVLKEGHFVDAQGEDRVGTMVQQENNLVWDYTKYDRLPIPAGAYLDNGKGGEGHGPYQHWYLPNKEYLAWEQENIYASSDGYYELKDEWQEEDLDTIFGPGAVSKGSISVYKFPIVGNGYITAMNNYGLSRSEPMGGYGNDDDKEGAIQAYQLFLKNGTLYLACDTSYASPESVYAWTYEYDYTIPSGTGLYVVMDGLAEALAAI